MAIAALLMCGMPIPASAAMLDQVRTVYLWPMSGALDQYLAEQIAAEGVFEVVIDPKLATAVMTERIDAPFLAAMDEYFPPENAPEKAETQASSDSIEGDFEIRRPKNRPVSRPRGTVFLVDVKTRQVLWSTFVKDWDSRPKRLHSRAQEIVDRLKRDTKSGE